MSNINMGRGGRSAFSSIDFYRRVPKDLTEVSRRRMMGDTNACWNGRKRLSCLLILYSGPTAAMMGRTHVCVGSKRNYNWSSYVSTSVTTLSFAWSRRRWRDTNQLSQPSYRPVPVLSNFQTPECHFFSLSPSSSHIIPIT